MARGIIPDKVKQKDVHNAAINTLLLFLKRNQYSILFFLYQKSDLEQLVRSFLKYFPVVSCHGLLLFYKKSDWNQ